jgi:hypothetical protein
LKNIKTIAGALIGDAIRAIDIFGINALSVKIKI